MRFRARKGTEFRCRFVEQSALANLDIMRDRGREADLLFAELQRLVRWARAGYVLEKLVDEH